MKFQILLVFTLIVRFSCSNSKKNKKKNEQSKKGSLVINLSNLIDSSELKKTKDSLSFADTINNIVDYSDFYIFFDNFMWDKNFQRNNIKFPMTIDSITVSTQKEWIHLPFYSNSKYIPYLFLDSTTNIIDDLDTITMSIINYAKRIATDYFFEKEKSYWTLYKIQKKSIDSISEISFLNFIFKHFNNEWFLIFHEDSST